MHSLENWRTPTVEDNTRLDTRANAIMDTHLGPPANLVMDQEGGMLSNDSTVFFERLQMKRVLIGTDGSTTKGLIERHIGLTKLAFMRFVKSCRAQSLGLTCDEMLQEITMS